jgi:hypothetical protein
MGQQKKDAPVQKTPKKGKSVHTVHSSVKYAIRHGYTPGSSPRRTGKRWNSGRRERMLNAPTKSAGLPKVH